jgi:pimeloyl-ACP methyl ester carboxylesterase
VRFFNRFAAVARLLVFDKRGTGMSDRLGGAETLETRMDDIRMVIDAAGFERAAICGLGESGPLCVLFAATYPERTSALVLVNTTPRFIRAPDMPWLQSRGDMEQRAEEMELHWGDMAFHRRSSAGQIRASRRRIGLDLCASSDLASVRARLRRISVQTWTWMFATYCR